MGKLGKALIFFLAAMLLLTGVSRAAASFTVAQVQVEQPQARKIVHTVNGDGMAEKMEEQPVYAASGVLVAKIKVQKGQSVEKGEVLARLDMDSIEEKIQGLEDEIQVLCLQNQALSAKEQNEKNEKNKTKKRAEEDYDKTISKNKESVEEAKQKVKDARKEADKKAEESYQKELEELKSAVAEAQKAYDDAKEQEESEILQAKRAIEDASKPSGKDYSTATKQIEINQKQRQLDELKKQKREGVEGLDEQIRTLEEEITTLKWEQQEKQDEVKRQEEQKKQTLARAQEDYNNTVKKNARLVSEAKKKLDKATQKLQDFLNREPTDIEEDTSVKDAENALKEAKKQQKDQKQQAKRTLEDASVTEANEDNSAAINRISIAEKQRQLTMLLAEKKNGGKIIAEMDGTVTAVQITVGEKTLDTAAFLLTDTSGGMRFTANVSKEDAAYVTAGDAVSLKTTQKTYEELSVLSLEPNEDQTIKVTVFVPKGMLSLGEHASMELTKQSEEYNVTIPISAVHTENKKNFVYVMEAEDTVLGGQHKAQRVDVTIAEKNGTYAALSGNDLTTDSMVIVNSDQMISAGEKVRLQED